MRSRSPKFQEIVLNPSQYAHYVAPPMTQTSPVVSLAMNNLPFASHASPTGLKQPLGQLALFALNMIFSAAVVLVTGSTGIPVWGFPDQVISTRIHGQ